MSKLNLLLRTSILLLLITPCLVSLKGNSQKATSTNAVSPNSECEEEIRLICTLRSIRAIFRSSGVIRLPINTSDVITEPSFISVRISGHSPHAYGWLDYAMVRGEVILNTTSNSISQGKLKSDIIMAEFENLLNMTLLYNRYSTSEDRTTYFYDPMNASSAIQKLRDAFLEFKPSQGFDKIVTPTLVDNRPSIYFALERENGNLIWHAGVSIYCPNYFAGGLYEEQTFSLRELANYWGTIDASPYSTKSTLGIDFDFGSMWFFGYVPDGTVLVFETMPSQMETSRGGEVFEKDITGGSVEDLHVRFKFVRTPLQEGLVWFSVVVLSAVIFGPLGFILWATGEDIKRGLRRMGKKMHISMSLVHDYGIQLVAVLSTCFLIYQFRNTIISLLGEIEGYSLNLSGTFLVAILIIVLFTTTPGFFVGLLTGREGEGMISVALGSFLAPWISFVYWAPGVVSLGADVLGFVLALELIIIGTIILALIIGGVGGVCGALGEYIGFSVRKKVLIKRKEPKAWELEDQLKELKEQLSLGVITQEEYEQKKKRLLEKRTKVLSSGLGEELVKLKGQLRSGALTQEEYEELHSALSNLQTGIITKYEYERRKKTLLEKSEE